LNKITVLDLFSGAGGLTRGFIETGRFRSIGAVEKNHDARESYRLNFCTDGSTHALFGDIEDEDKVNPSAFPEKPQVIIGGPPCQDFTQLTAVRKEVSRRRNDLLWKHYLRIVLGLKPKVFVIENVPNLLMDEEYEEQRTVLRHTVDAAGYAIEWGVLTASAFGLPQSRRRAIIIGVDRTLGRTPYLPSPTLEVSTAWSAINDLENRELSPIVHGDKQLRVDQLHIGRNSEILSRLRYLYVLPDGNRMQLPKPITIKSWVDKESGTSDGYGRVFALRPSSTIRCEGFKPEKGRFLHPFKNRPLTLAEMARLQTFPDDHIFYGSHTSIARQIGNAVPPRLARYIAEVVLDLLSPTPLEVVTRPEKIEERVKVSGSNSTDKVLHLLKLFVGKPVPWWRIEAALQKDDRKPHVDWSTPLQSLRDNGFVVTVGNGVNGLRVGEYRLESPERAPVPDRPEVQRLFRFVESKHNKCCDCCQAFSSCLTPQLVRSPDKGGLLVPDNVVLLCQECLATRKPEAIESSPAEREVLNWIKHHRHVPHIMGALRAVLGLVDVPAPSLPPVEAPEDLAECLTQALSNATSCTLCGKAKDATLAPELIRPIEHGGYVGESNVWVLCQNCRSELEDAVIKVPAPELMTDGKDPGRFESLRKRFSEPGFLTPIEGHMINWLRMHLHDPLTFSAARAALSDNPSS
jgi:DNA (cytosine-5)-methyltransferase 1